MINKNYRTAAGFTTRQQLAIKHFSGPMLVLAGPGSGKTTVLTNRVRFLTEEMGILPENILVITFTKAAAEEMRERYLRLSGQRVCGVTFGTFHSVFLSFLLKAERYRSLRVAERNECLRVLCGVFFRMYGNDALTNSLLSETYDTFGRIRNGLTVSDRLAEETIGPFTEEMRKRGLLDFDDMLTECLSLLQNDPRLLRALRSKYQYILIDEFQDINRVQYEAVRLLAGDTENVFAVGDDDQSIYGFRGSDPSFMRQFEKDFRAVKKVILTDNYRSSGNIVKLSLKLIRNNKERYQKKLKAVHDRGPVPEIRCLYDEIEEAEMIANTVRIYRDAAEKTGYKTLTFALLARTHDVLSGILTYLPKDVKAVLSCMTFHASKGLEFDVVFLAGANEGITPDKKSVHSGNTEEERREFYVAMTRSRRYLHILYTEMVYKKISKPSPFVLELLE